MLINLRNALMGGKRLPYDAEVEYLRVDAVGPYIVIDGVTYCNAVGTYYAFTISSGGVVTHDLIPVRLGNTGYMYDRITNKRFGNAGTGDFVLGLDVVPVEYIESHGTERIDTGFKADNTCKFRIDMENRGDSDYWLFGSRNGTSTATDKSCLYAFISSSIGYAMMGSAMPSFNSMLIKDGKHMIEMSLADGFVIDGDVSATYTASEQAEVFTNSYPISIFTMYNGSSYFNTFAGRVYLFSITSGGVSRLNLLPVRVGTEGAMMDVLTRRIYRNAGTGAFTYGNDLKYPIPSS